MKAHTSQFKENIAKFGRELDSKITYTLNNEEVELGSEQLNSITPHYEGAILKSVMKQLDIDSNVEIPIGTILRYQFGVKVGNEYEYIDYGNYVVYSVEKQEDTYSYKITCYDKMLYAMKDYENSNITFPIAIKDYLEAICEKVGLEYEGSQFANSDKVIDNELYLDNEGRSLDYTFRDVLDEIAQVSGGTICINNDDKLEVRYIKDVGELVNATGGSLALETDSEVALDNFELEGKTEQDHEPTPDYPSELVSVGYENLLENIATTQTTNGITFTKNADGTITANGTATGTAICFMQEYPYTIPSGNYILSGCPSGGSTSTYKLDILNNSGGVLVADVGSGVNLSLSTDLVSRGVRIVVYSGTTLTNAIFKPIITKGTQAHSYIPYGKYGIEVKNQNKNLVSLKDKTTFTSFNVNITVQDNEITINGTTSSAGRIIITELKDPLEIINGVDYTLSAVVSGTVNNNFNVQFRDDGNTTNIITRYNNVLPSTFNNFSGVATILCFYVANNMTFTNYKMKLQLEKGITATNYESRKSNTYLYTLDNPLRSIGDTKDLLYIKNGMLYVERNIGSVMLDGSETDWSNQSGTYDTANRMMFSHNCSADIQENMANRKGLSNYFVNYPSTVQNANVDVTAFNFHPNINYSKYIYFKIEKSVLPSQDVAGFKSWLSTHNTEVQYLLAEPYTEELGQVDMPSTYEGVTYIDAPNTMNISYISEFEEIDEEYLKDVNVNFGEKFGAVNTIVLSRGGDGDKIGLSIPSNLADEDKIAIQITDNQIMNGNNRADFMQPILSQLYGLEYYINDFSSTGICYLDLCDRYRIKIGDNSYKCIMFNDEVDITQGLEELIYTDMQEENEQEYKYVRSDDRGITQANILAKKNEASITAFTQQLDSTNNRLNSVETKQTATDATINVMSTHIDTNGNVTEVTTTTGFTFNADGMTISDTSTNFSALHRNTGTYYYDGNTITGQYTKDGSKQKDLELFGVYYYGMDDIDDTPMFVAQLYTDENGEECVGHFFNRGE